MKLVLTRAGGVAGIRKPPLSLDTQTLAEPARQRLQALVDAAKLPELPARLGEARPDELGYELSVTHDDGRSHTIEFSHASAPPELRALVAELRAASLAG
jgi:hypothetical protein